MFSQLWIKPACLRCSLWFRDPKGPR